MFLIFIKKNCYSHYEKNRYFQRNISHGIYSIRNIVFSHGYFWSIVFHRKVLNFRWNLPMDKHFVGKYEFPTDFTEGMKSVRIKNYPQIKCPQPWPSITLLCDLIREPVVPPRPSCLRCTSVVSPRRRQVSHWSPTLSPVASHLTVVQMLTIGLSRSSIELARN